MILELMITEGNVHEPIALRRDDLTHLEKLCVSPDLLLHYITSYLHIVTDSKSFRV